MARPRKIADSVELENRMRRCAEILYFLRYGRKGILQIKERAPCRKLTFEEWNAGAGKAPARYMWTIHKIDSEKKLFFASLQKVIGVMEVAKEDFPRLRENYRTKSRDLDIELWLPVDSDMKAWNGLNREESSKAEMVSTAGRIQRWAKKFGINLVIIASLSKRKIRFHDVITQYANQLRQAKKLPHYPRSERGRSDDKRIQFLAKVIAGLSFNASPLYATKKLSHKVYTREQAIGWGSFTSRYPFPVELMKALRNKTKEKDNESKISSV